MLMTKGSFSCKRAVIYGHWSELLSAKANLEFRAATGAFFFFYFFFFLLARARLHFLCLHAKVFRTAINSVLVWVDLPAGLAKPFIILGAWNCKALSQVVGINIGWPRLFTFHQMRGDAVVWRLCRPSVCQALCFFHTGVRQKGNVISYGSFVIH